MYPRTPYSMPPAISPNDDIRLQQLTEVREELAARFALAVEAACYDVATRLDDLGRDTKDADRRKQLQEASRHLLYRGKEMRGTIHQAVAKEFDKRLLGSAEGAVKKPMIFTLNSLTLQDDVEVQQDIALNDAARRLKESCDFEFFLLTMRLQSLAGRNGFADADNPVIPRVFCKALLDGLTAVEAAAPIRLDAFNAFQSDLTALLPKIYKEVNQILIGKMVMPEIVESYGKPVIRPDRQAGRSGLDELVPSAVPSADLSALFQRMVGMAGGGGGVAGAGRGGSGAGPVSTIDQGNLAEVLSRLAGGLAETREKIAGIASHAGRAAGGQVLPSTQFNRTFVGSIAFFDIVGFSRKTVDDQQAVKERFNRTLSQAVMAIPAELRITLDTGDGAALGFLGDPEDALFAAMQVRRLLTAGQETAFTIRTGINLGPVKLVRDVNGSANLIGDGINAAQRIMNFAPAGAIAASRSYYDVVSVMSEEYAGLFVWQGDQADKHARGHTVYLIGDSDAAFARAQSGVTERAARPGEEAASDSNATDGSVPQDTVVVDASFLTAINRLQSGWIMTPPPAAEIAPPADVTQRLPATAADWDAAETLVANANPDQTLRLPALHQQSDEPAEQPAPDIPAAAVENVLRQVKEQLAPEMSAVSAAVTDLLASIFDRILGDASIPAYAKALLGALQMPALKAAIVDVDLLTSPQHPLRVLIDRIALLAEQRGETLRPGQPLFAGLQELVGRVQEQFGGELDVIEAALAELDVLLESEEATVQAETEATVREAEREEKWQQAEEQANREVTMRMRAYCYPDAVEIFVTLAWRHVLREAFLAGGSTGEAWQQALTTLNALLWSVRADVVQEQHGSLTRLIPALVTRLHDGLDRVGIPREGRSLFFEELVELHRKALKPTPARKPSAQVPDATAATVPAAPAPAAAAAEPQWPASPPTDRLPALMVTTPPDLKRGQWLQMHMGGDHWHPCRLTWVSPSGENYVFKDFALGTAFTISAFDLKNKLRGGAARRIVASSLTQRSIDGAVADMMQKAGE